MKYFKLIFNKSTLLILSTFVRLLFVIFVVYYMSTLGGWFSYVVMLLRFFIFLKIINDPTNPSHKIPWLVVCLAFPIIGITLYILFSKKFVSYRRMQVVKKTNRVAKKFLLKTNGEDFSKLGKYEGQSKYIYSQCSMPLYSNTAVKYFKTGQEFWQSLLADLNNAKSFIFMEYFYIKNGTMWKEILRVLGKKVAEGVEVRVMYDDIGSIAKNSSSFAKSLKKLGIKVVVYNKFVPVISAVHNNRDHRKITVVDGVIGYTGGVNIGDEYINYTHPFGYWKDTAVRLYGRAVDNLTVMFLQQYNSQTRQVDMYSRYCLASKCNVRSHGYVQPFCDGPKPVYMEQVGENTYLNIINQAKNSIVITTPYFIVDYEIMNALKIASSRGVDVRIVIPGIPDKKIIYALTKDNCSKLIDSGIKVYTYTPGFIHAKMILADDKVAVVGTMNFDYRSLVHHYEDGVYMCDCEAVKDIKDDMQSIMEISTEETSLSIKVNFFLRLICSVVSVFSPLF